jgi:N-acetylglucosamine kinase-like BadF-type ATPase
MSFLIGVDAGGSRTTAAVSTEVGVILGRAEAGPGALRPGLIPVAAAAIYSAARDAMQRARVQGPAAMVVIGAAGAAHPAERAALTSALEGSGIGTRLTITTDAEIALEAAFGQEPGIVLLAGTGSVAWARFADGTTARTGGLGPVLGDRGSGHDLGREALRAAGVDIEMELHLDLTQRLAKHLAIPVGDLPRWSVAATVPEIAALAPVVLDTANTGDGVARSLAQAAARHLGTLVASLARRFPTGATIHAAYGGGLLTARPDYRALVLECITDFVPGVIITPEPVDAVAGAIAMSRRLAGQ